MVKYKDNNGFHVWSISKDSKQTLFEHVIPAIIWNYGGDLRSVNEKSFRDLNNNENFCGKISYLYKLLENNENFWMEIDILGCRCNVWVTFVDNGCELKIGALNGINYEKTMVKYIDNIFKSQKGPAFCVKGDTICDCRWENK